ncbi:MAG TPA: hypothetical protein VJK29_17405, partial [Terriglobales bacterium]|nr:hypothetical protein [Terriglobales bacterium]
RNLALSESVTREQERAVNMRQTRMNTALRYCLNSFTIFTVHFDYGNGMEEVVGSNPTRSTKVPIPTFPL